MIGLLAGGAHGGRDPMYPPVQLVVGGGRRRRQPQQRAGQRVPAVHGQQRRVQAHQRRVRVAEHGVQQRAALERRQPRPGRRRGAPPQLARRAPDEHIIRGRVQHPVVALPRVVVMSRYLHEAFVQAEVVPDGVLPALFVLLVVREVLHDVLVNAV